MKYIHNFSGTASYQEIYDTFNVADGDFPPPLLVTTYPFEHVDKKTHFGICVWTRFVKVENDNDVTCKVLC